MFSDVLRYYHNSPGCKTFTQLTLIMAGIQFLYAEVWIPHTLHDVFLRVQKKETVLFILSCAIGKIVDLSKLEKLILCLDLTKRALSLKRVFHGEASYLRTGIGVLQLFLFNYFFNHIFFCENIYCDKKKMKHPLL